jgi:hypothetical protein
MPSIKKLLSGLPVIAAVIPLACLMATEATAAGPQPHFRTTPALIPRFDWNQHDYAVRCMGKPLEVSLHVPSGWHATTGSRKIGEGDRQLRLPMREGQRHLVRFRQKDGPGNRGFHVRCLPADFSPFEVSTSGEGGPRLTMVQLSTGYAAAFDSGGAPVWWYQGKAAAASKDLHLENAQFMADGTFSYAPINGLLARQFQVRTLEGRLVRRVTAAKGLKPDLHDLQLLPNGNYLLGAHRIVDEIDTTAYGGPPDASLDTAQIQELRPDGSLAWKWNAWPRIGLAQSGHWWKQLLGWGQPYDVHHWNSVARRGKYMLLSFRHLDAVLRINRRTGRIVWKLGGTKTGKRLRVIGDPHGRYPFGGQHDARMAPGGSVTVFDNNTNFNKVSRRPPRAVRYRIDRRKMTARLISQVKDPRIDFSIGFGSARLDENGNWLVGWGAIGPGGLIGGYRPDGKSTFSLKTPAGPSYRGNVVTSAKPTIQRLRLAMDRMFRHRR